MSVCPACECQTLAAVPEEPSSSHRFSRCGECELVFADPMPVVDGRWYEQQVMYSIRDHFMSDLQWNHRQFLRDRPCSGGRLLDVGCGTGVFLAAARQAGYRVTGFDFDAEAVRMARGRWGLTDLVESDLWDFRTRRGTERFEVVTAFEVLEHSPAPGSFLQRVSELVVPRGFLALSVPNRDRWPRFKYNWDVPPNHLTWWNDRTLSRLLERFGFTVIRMTIGWKQGESLLHQRLQFGLVSRLLRPRDARNGDVGSPSRTEGSLRMASAAFRIKSRAIKVLAPVVNLCLGAIGATGMGIYVLAQRKR